MGARETLERGRDFSLPLSSACHAGYKMYSLHSKAFPSGRNGTGAVFSPRESGARQEGRDEWNIFSLAPFVIFMDYRRESSIIHVIFERAAAGF